MIFRKETYNHFYVIILYKETGGCMDLEKFGKFIKKLREEKGLSQTELSEIIHVTRQAVSKWEVGKSLPDSFILLDLSKLFNVTINELLQGSRNDKTEPVELENITLSLVDDYNSKSKELIKVVKLFLIIILTLIFILFSYYFFTSYNSIKLYRIQGKGNNFFIFDGIMLKTNKKLYIKLGKIQNIDSKAKIKIKKIALYYLHNNKKNYIYIDENSNSEISYIDSYNYGDINHKNSKYLIKNLYLKIEYNNNKREIIKLRLEEDFSNDIKQTEYKNVIKEKYVTSNNEIKLDLIKKKILKKGTKENEIYKYVVNDNNKKIGFYYSKEVLYIIKEEDRETEIWRLFTNTKNILFYENLDNKNKKHNEINIKDINKMEKKDKEIYTKAFNYIYKYLIL